MLNNIKMKNIIKGTVKLSIVDDKNDQSRQSQLLRVFTSNCILLQHSLRSLNMQLGAHIESFPN